jgi:hypothetical protein
MTNKVRVAIKPTTLPKTKQNFLKEIIDLRIINMINIYYKGKTRW